MPGYSRSATWRVHPREEFDRTFSVDVKGPFFVSQQAIPRLRDGGRIINISSAVTRLPSPQYAAYSMAKAAVNTLTVVLAAELGKRGITANTVAPGLTATEMTASMLQDPRRCNPSITRRHLAESGPPTILRPWWPFLLHRMPGG